MTLGTKIVLNNSTPIWFERTVHNMLQPDRFVLVHCNVLPDGTVLRQGTNCCSLIVLCSRTLSFSCTYIPVLSRPDEFKLQSYVL
jgi:hypothetical protein